MNTYDMSEKAEVSVVTVSRVPNGNPNANEGTRNRVLGVMRELGYIPNMFARRSGLGTMETIGIMCSNSSDPYLASAAYYLERGLWVNGYDFALYCTDSSSSTKQEYFDFLLSKWVDAIILASSKFVELKPEGDAYIPEAAKGLPIALVNGYLDDPNIYNTVCDDHAAMYRAMESLIAIGHGNILYFYTSHPYSGQNGIQGYKDALAAHYISMSEELIHQCSRDVIASRELLL